MYIVSATEWFAPAAIWTTLYGASVSTLCGVVVLSRVWSPVCPAFPLPNAYTAPDLPSRSVWSFPHAIFRTGSCRLETWIGKAEEE